MILEKLLEAASGHGEVVEEGEGVGGGELRGGQDLRGLVEIFQWIRPHRTSQLQPLERGTKIRSKSSKKELLKK